jgi:uncharacterized protein YegP (UPF0339 family)
MPVPQFYVTYHAKNGEILATSELLETKVSALKNIKSMMKNIGLAIGSIERGNLVGANRLKDMIEDLTK